MSTPTIQLHRAAAVCAALDARAQHDRTPTHRREIARSAALRLLNAGRSAGSAVAAGLRLLRQVHA